ncbi:MAG: YmdB family metallophosphoesterase [Spirochaetaceae bacterium]|jgi:metallophosphoesterase (TIGR00282 family)|nr:YmdB family metallophosphoesterase [Spirochaetaceae bacterium]
MSSLITVFMGGDIYGDPGLRVLEEHFPSLKEREGIDFAVINGENAANGFGILESDAERIFSAGIDVITGGNHTLEKRDVWPFLSTEPRMLRPANYPRPGIPLPPDTYAPGAGFGVFSAAGGSIAVLNLQGRESMTSVDCPFACAEAYLKEAAGAGAFLLVDFHAESNEEKEALGLFLAGRAAAVCGTHTHVQTADERVLSGGTAYITDLGMTGPEDSVIGSVVDTAIRRNITQVPYKMEPSGNEAVIQGVVIGIDAMSGKAVSIRRVVWPERG